LVDSSCTLCSQLWYQVFSTRSGTADCRPANQ